MSAARASTFAAGSVTLPVLARAISFSFTAVWWYLSRHDHLMVEGTGAGVLGRWSAGDDLKLIDGIEVDALRDDTVIALLVDGLGGHAIDVELAEVVAGSADDGHSYAGLRAGSEGSEGTAWWSPPPTKEAS